MCIYINSDGLLDYFDGSKFYLNNGQSLTSVDLYNLDQKKITYNNGIEQIEIEKGVL